MGMNLEWPAEPRHEPSPVLRSANTSTHYRTETEVASSSSVSPEDPRNARWAPPAPDHHPEHAHPLSSGYAEQWPQHAYPANSAMPTRSYSYPAQSALHPVSSDTRLDAEAHEGGREESVWHGVGRGGQEEQQYWGTQNRHDHAYDPDNLAPAFSASTSAFPNMLHPPGRQATSATSPHSPYEFQQADEFYGSRNHER
ncbi:hypothetical protein FIBSPDRAFT_337071 [Athelia psychrophila]|uniref:Uncharacterized protein n=1 Tax=Athelia psychrophila TaxID=1759441 RepID=A0A167WD56_9AGAM|nr:hypothetical protein FIBSPDRAFT_337071 [Fibularhizoctonia sp. CBS 109695]